MSSSSIIPSSQARVLFLHVSAGVLPKSFSLIRFLYRSNRDRKSTRLNSSHIIPSRMPSSA